MPERAGYIFDGRHRRPGDVTAALVTAPEVNEVSKHTDFRFYKGVLTTSFPRDMKRVPDTIKKDLTGMRKGKLTVIGYIGFKLKSGGRKKSGAKIKLKVHYWQVRCDCGKYETRTNIVLRKKQTYEYKNACAFCWKQEQKDMQTRTDILKFWHPV